MSNRQIHGLFYKSWDVFEEWPGNYFAFLAWRRTRVSESKSVRGIQKDFAGYKFHLYQQTPSDQLNFMKDAFEQYLATMWEGGYSSQVKRLGEKTRQKEKYVSKRVAMRLLNVAVRGIDSFIAAGKLKAVVRPEGRRRMVLIDQESLREFKQVFDRSLYLNQVTKALGVPNYRVMELVNCGLLNPLRGPDVDGTADWRFDEDELRCLLDSIKEKIKPQSGLSNTDTISFLRAARRLNRVGTGIGVFIRAVLEGKIIPCGEGRKRDLASIQFSDNQVIDYMCQQRSAKMGEVFSVDEASRCLEVSSDFVRRLTKVGILPSQPRENKRDNLLISKADLEQFKLTYVLSKEVATQLSTVPGSVTSLLKSKGVYPVSGPRVDGGRYYVFRRVDLYTIGLMGSGRMTQAIVSGPYAEPS